MRVVLGLLVLFIGFSMAVLWMPAHDGERQLAVVTEIATKGIARVAPVETRAPAPVSRTFSPQTPLMAPEQPNGPRPTIGGAATRSSSAASGNAAAGNTPSGNAPSGSAASGGAGSGAPGEPGLVPHGARSAPGHVAAEVVARGTMAPLVVRAPEVKPAIPTATRPRGEASRVELVRNLQRELKRVGCYHGDVDGSWGRGTKRAMGTFVERVNASLPVEVPDYVLLTMLQGHAAQACGAGCPAGQALSDGGRCVPNAVLARRSGDGSRRVAARDREPAAPSAGTWSTIVQPAPAVAQPPVAATASTATAALASTPTSAVAPTAAMSPPPVGRSTLGGPRVSEPDTAAPPVASPATRAVRGPAADRPRWRPSPGPSYVDRPAREPSVRRRAPSRTVYRAAPPRYAAPRYVPSRTASSRSWTATFFNNSP